MMLRKSLLGFLLMFLVWSGYSQSIHGSRDQNWKELYRESPELLFNLRHTKLKVSFDLPRRYLYGEEWVTVRPHFYAQDVLTLDAKNMLIHTVQTEAGKDLVYKYDGKKLNIILDKTYTRNDSLTVYIKYTARPEEVTQTGSAAIMDAKGLYFINPDGTEKGKPTQIWTQGETEASSCWFPTIDAPNQKTTQEIYITVPEQFVTLSNGTLESQTKGENGTRTDYWKFMMPHAPYLFYMGVGEFSIVKDTWRNIPVDYYVEKEYEPYARGIFGNTPGMLDFFSKITGIDYPWPKYAQMVCRDYVSGAMENTTAVIHAENANQDDRQLADENIWEDVIAHELFHHWFGDYVTCESWSQLTMNESFANYSEYLWREHKYGRDHADQHLMEDVAGYMQELNYGKDLVRFYYRDKEDMFDAVSYNKGGAILHMLRYFLGDEAFFAGLNKYLIDNKFGTGEAHQLRLALEAVSGRDLNWFFDQWYFGSGHPKLEITYTYNTAAKKVEMKVLQTQTDKVFRLPMKVDVYTAGGKSSNNIWIEKKEQIFFFDAENEPLLVNADADRVLLAEIKENKTTNHYIYQLANAPRYLDRKLALDYLLENSKDKSVKEALVKALNDPYHGIREDILGEADFTDKGLRKLSEDKVRELAQKDESNLVKAAALEVLAEFAGKSDLPLFEEALKSKSYSVAGAGLQGVYSLDKKRGLEFAKNFAGNAKENALSTALVKIYLKEKEDAGLAFVANYVYAYMFIQDEKTKAEYQKGYDWVVSSDHEEANKVLVDKLAEIGKKYERYGVMKLIVGEIQKIKAEKEKMLSKNSSSDSLKKQVSYIDETLKLLSGSR